jgi:hypothetical protein
MGKWRQRPGSGEVESFPRLRPCIRALSKADSTMEDSTFCPSTRAVVSGSLGFDQSTGPHAPTTFGFVVLIARVMLGSLLYHGGEC